MVSLASAASAFFPPVFFKPTARANGVRENAEIWYTDPSGHVLDAHRVSSLSSDGNPFNRRTDRQGRVRLRD